MFKKSRKLDAYFNLSLCILLWASIPVATKKVLVELDNLQMLFYSTILSTLVLGGLVLFRKKTKEFMSYNKKQYFSMFSLGFLGNYMYYVFLYGALSKTTASEGFILAYTWPMLVLVLSFVILKEEVTVKKLLGVIISFLGIIIITTKGNITDFNLTSLSGDILAISGAFVFALFSVLGKKYNFDKIVSVFIYFFSALIFLIPTVFIFSKFVWPSPRVLLWLIYNGIFVNGISYIFWFKALEKGETHIISNLLYLTPFISLIFIAIFLDEKILISSVIGLVVIIFGVSLQYLNLHKNKKQNPCEVISKKRMDN